MSALETLRALASGQRPEAGLLHNCRLDALGTEAYGEEAIVSRLRRSPLTFTERAEVVESTSHIVLLEANSAVFADLWAGNIARIWLLSEGEPETGEAGISVPFDPDQTQARGDVFFALSDHPGLSADAAERVRSAGRALVDAYPHSMRTRAFAIRAFGTVSRGAALFAGLQMTGTESGTAGFAMAVISWHGDTVTTIRDYAGEQTINLKPWTPRIGRGKQDD
jgi:hypothetical protein